MLQDEEDFIANVMVGSVIIIIVILSILAIW